MLPYWLFFLVPALAALQARPVARFYPHGTHVARLTPAWFAAIMMLTLIIGLRYKVGGDWGNYFRYLYGARNLTLSDLAAVEDPGYWALNMLSTWLGWGITGVNLLGGLFFAAGLVVFCRSLPRPWLALNCAMPYFVTVVAMGYTRQAIAVGLAMIGLVALQRSRYVRFGMWVLLGALFHKSAVVLVPIAALAVDRNRIQVFGVVGLMAYIGYEALLGEHVDRLTRVYQDANLQSSGAFIRLAMNALPSTLMLLFHKRFTMGASAKRLWIIVSLTSLGMFAAYFPTNLSTALDRMALYFIPIQLVVFAHLPDAIGRPGGRNQAIVAGILLYYAAVLFVWLNFAQHSNWWLPYRMGFA